MTVRLVLQGQCYIAVNPACFAPGFDGRLTDLITQIKGLKKVRPPRDQVLLLCISHMEIN